MQLLSNDSCTILFENIETLYKVNGELLKELKKNSDNIAQAFYKLAPFLKLYSVYAYNYKRALFLLQVYFLKYHINFFLHIFYILKII